MMADILHVRFSSDPYQGVANSAALWSAMLWPDDRECGLDFVKWVAKQFLLEHSGEFSSDAQKWFRDKILARDYETKRFSGRDMRRRIVHGAMAGAVLDMRLNGFKMDEIKRELSKVRGGRNKTAGLVNVDKGTPIRIGPVTIQNEAWRDFGKVSHFWTSSFFLGERKRHRLPETEGEWITFLRTAQNLREAAEGMEIRAAKKMWRIEIMLANGLLST